MFTFKPDLTKREFTVLLLLVIPTVLFGVYPAAILDAVHYGVSTTKILNLKRNLEKELDMAED
jgi:NADH:ubiquinone oxidoreductase subunit 4 (subunit M)